ncbi:hypothetical protein IV487_13210, partial [Enterococcus saccharolyticus]|uniref:hypothetical protein n=1 Tax=Enterococcus saccharolyticus TaxID=41997 RepID=UPI001E5F035C
MKNILISTRNLITKFLLKVYKYLENRRNRYKVYVLSIVFSFLAVYILYYVLELFKLKKYISIFNGFFVSIMTFAFIFLLVDLMTVFIDFIIDEINKKNYEKKMKKIKASYSGWVQNSQFGQVYDVLSYLDAKVIENNDSLSDLIKSSYSSLDSLEDTNDY